MSKMKPPKGGAIVRMYCAGLGDCFLLGFPGEKKGETSYVLIDCGVWKGTRAATQWMKKIMEHIRDEVDGRGIELLVATHQHWDHLSGFHQAKDIFQDIQVRQVWLPWTENLEDPVALRMAQERRLALHAAAAAVHQLRRRFKEEDRPPEDPEGSSALRTTVENLEAVLQFAGYTPPANDAPPQGYDSVEDLLGAGPTTDDLMDLVRKKVTQPSYPPPSIKPRDLAGIPGVRIYVLGPPTNPKYLGKDDPSTSPGKSEVYVAGIPMNEDGALFGAAYSPKHPTPEDTERHDSMFPFNRWQRYPRKTAAEDKTYGPFFQRHYERVVEWRRIENDWLEAAGQLVLNLDNHVNNTSLVLAFELGKDGPVLLFPGDAQVGNWLSWHELESDNGVTAERLLNRTVLYKVGHHASHNATLKDKGLKMMTRTSTLVAMIPVDEMEAHKPKGKNKNGWAMPYDKLLSDLMLRTEGRVLRADLGLKEPQAGEMDWTPEMSKRWSDFKKGIEDETAKIEVAGETVTKTLFYQYTVRPLP